MVIGFRRHKRFEYRFGARMDRDAGDADDRAVDDHQESEETGDGDRGGVQRGLPPGLFFICHTERRKERR